MPEDDEYDVGYRKPPKASQFQKGKSGNSRGRPKQEPGIGLTEETYTNRIRPAFGQGFNF
jgi:hypothetical protein